MTLLPAPPPSGDDGEQDLAAGSRRRPQQHPFGLFCDALSRNTSLTALEVKHLGGADCAALLAAALSSRAAAGTPPLRLFSLLYSEPGPAGARAGLSCLSANYALFYE